MIIEQCSLKEWIYDNEDVKGLDIRSMHILFRPSQTPNLEDRKVAFFKGQLDVTLEWKISEITQAKVVLYSDAEQHDKDMAVLQAVMHRILLVAGNELSGCLGSTFISQKVVELEKRIKKGDKELYKKIQQNKHLPKQMEEIKKRLDRFDIEDYMK